MNSHETLKIFSMNSYLGADLNRVLTSRTPAELFEAAEDTWAHVQETRIPERADRIAAQIAEVQPHIAALQEVVQWYSGTPDRMRLEYDFLDLILGGLSRRGLSYMAAATFDALDQTVPYNGGEVLRLRDRQVILRRLGSAEVEPVGISSGAYSTLCPLSFSGIAIGSIRRGWIALDARLNDAKFRFIATHLESFDGEIQAAQAEELSAGPAEVELPVIVAGDFNSNALQEPGIPDCTPTYPNLIAKGFQDAWAAVNPDDPGYTGVQAADLRNPESALNRRIDLILLGGSAVPLKMRLVASTPSVRTESGLWPSDHAGLVAEVGLPRN